MKTKKLLLVLSSLALGGAVVSCKKTPDTPVKPDKEEVDPFHNDDMNKWVDSFDNQTSEIIFASPDVKTTYDFQKCVDENINEYPVTYEEAGHAGTIDDPMDIYSALHMASAGDTVYLLPGTYDCPKRIYLEHSGNAKRPIKVSAYQDDNHKGKVTLDFTKIVDLYNGVLQHFAGNARGVQLNGDYWHWYGIDIANAGDNGMYVAGSFNKIERCNFHENQDTGLQLGRASSVSDIINWPHDNLILNCTSYNNYDIPTLGENADGFAAKLTIGEGNVFDGCIAYRNSDDGWDLYAKTDSGNIGTVSIINCVAFENGFVLDKTKSETAYKGDVDTEDGMLLSYASQNGDGNGFKLGGSIMTGDTIVKNCMSFNNKMGGFADNSNPGVLSLSDCTAYNNSVYMYMTSTTNTIDPTGATGIFGLNDGENSNFAMARTEASYNNFSGCLSYLNNVEEGKSAAWDTYKGSAQYCLFASGRNKHMAITTPIDASSYESAKMGDLYKGTINDDSFKSLTLLEGGASINGHRDIDELFRNADGSVNMHDFLALKDEELLKFNNGKPIGCTLNKNSMAEYEHFDFADFEGQDISKEYAHVQGAKDVLDIMCNPTAVFQDVNLLTEVNGLKVSWYSDNEDVISVGYNSINSVSGRKYVIGNVKRDRNEDKVVTLVATIVENSVVLTKEFKLNVIKETPAIGSITGVEDKYICEQFDDFVKPEINVTDKASYSGNKLVSGSDYDLDITYEYAISTKDLYNVVDDVYTAKPGVYKVTYTITSKLGDDTTIKCSYLVYVNSKTATIDVSDDAELAAKYGIEMTNGKAFTVNASRDGAKVTAAFTNIYGYMYVATSTTPLTAEQIIANGTRVDIADEVAEGIAKNANTSAYDVYMVVTNRSDVEAKKYVSDVYTSHVDTKSITTATELHSILTGLNDSKTIYVMQNDIDFTDFTKSFAGKTTPFTGVLNGNGHKISNITIASTDATQSANIIAKLKNGTVMNVTFENINISSTNTSDKNTGIIGNMCGGYISNVALKNIYVAGVNQVGALVGQVSGGSNFINNVSLTGNYSTEAPQGTDEQKQALYAQLKPAVKCSTKYYGGLVGNMQKDTQELKVELSMEDIYVKAYVGDHNDGGYVGGILGRDKNEFASYKLYMNRCVFVGIVDTNKTYSAGIVGSFDSAAGYIDVENCISDTILVCAAITLDYSTEIGQKNNSPIVGRLTYVEGLQTFIGNAGPYNEYHMEVNSNAENFKKNIVSESFYTSKLYDLENTWVMTKDEAGNNTGCILRNAL
ncbi:MAG: hypothetical protein K6G28_04410 [Acholeplasmatales bacterium]|nr:hypothetical protein [Acholeplasmatales bacterium]